MHYSSDTCLILSSNSSYIANYTIYIYIYIYIYILYKVEKPSVCLSALFWRSGSRLWLHGLMSDLLDVIAMSSGMTKFIFKSF